MRTSLPDHCSVFIASTTEGFYASCGGVPWDKRDCGDSQWRRCSANCLLCTGTKRCLFCTFHFGFGKNILAKAHFKRSYCISTVYTGAKMNFLLVVLRGLRNEFRTAGPSGFARFKAAYLTRDPRCIGAVSWFRPQRGWAACGATDVCD